MKMTTLRKKAFEVLDQLCFFSESQAIEIICAKVKVDKYTAKRFYLEWLVSKSVYESKTNGGQ